MFPPKFQQLHEKMDLLSYLQQKFWKKGECRKSSAAAKSKGIFLVSNFVWTKNVYYLWIVKKNLRVQSTFTQRGGGEKKRKFLREKKTTKNCVYTGGECLVESAKNYRLQ